MNLEDASTEELISELQRRHVGLVVLTLVNEATRDEVMERTHHYYYGGRLQAIGMAQEFIKKTLEMKPR